MRTRVILPWLLALALASQASAEPPAPAPGPARAATPGTVRFAAVGDIMTHWIQIQAAWKPSCKCHDFAPMFADARALLGDADVTFGNLETTMPGDPRRYTPKGTVLFGAPDSLADAVAGAGFDVVATANNHAADTGGEGVKNTLAQLDRVGVLHAGSWPTPEARAANPVLRFEKNGLRIAMVAYSYGSNEGKPDGAALATLPNLSGNVQLAFQIGGDGKVGQSLAQGLKNDAVERCMTEVVKTVSFPPPPDGKTTTAFIPVLVRPKR